MMESSDEYPTACGGMVLSFRERQPQDVETADKVDEIDEAPLVSLPWKDYGG
jgi:hypothetical protein